MESSTVESTNGNENGHSKSRFYPKALEEITFHSWNNEFEEAEKAAGEGRTTYPHHSFLYAGISNNKAWISTSVEDRHAAVNELKVAEDLARLHIDSDEKLNELVKAMTGKSTVDPIIKWNWLIDCKLVLGNCLLNKAIFQMTLGNYVKGAYNLRKSWKLFQKIQNEIAAKKKEGIKVEEEIQDEVNFGLAVFYFFVSFSPGAVLKVLEILGFVANRDLGIQYMNEVIEKGALKEPNAALFLLLNYLIIPTGLTKKEDNLDAARKILDKVLKKYSKGSFFLLMAGQLEMKKGNLQSALTQTQAAIDSVQHLPMVPNSYYTNLAAIHYMSRDWKTASEVLEKLCQDSNKEFDMKGMSGIQLATCYSMLDEQEKAEKVLARVPGMISKNSRFDKLAERKLSSFKKRGLGFGVFEIMFIRRDLHHLKNADLKPLLELLEQQHSKVKENPETKAVYLLLKAVLVQGLGETEKAKTYLKEIISSAKQIKEEIWTIPNAHQELAEMLYWEGDKDAAEELYKAAIKYKDYDFDEVVRNRIKLSLDKIQKEKVASSKEEKRKTKG